MPKLDLAAARVALGSSYPEPYRTEVGERERRFLGDLAGLTHFGVNLLTLAPGAKSSLRHWHSDEDEFVYVLEGEVVLVEDGGETAMHPGDAAGFRAGVPDGHRLENRSSGPARVLEVGTSSARDTCTYSDVDLINHTEGKRSWFTLRDGTPTE